MNKQRIVALKQVEHTNNEQRILTSIEHPFIVTLWGIFQCSTYLYMVMDFVPGGELFMLLRRSGVGLAASFLSSYAQNIPRHFPTPSQNSMPQR
jgi:serine/threonine protein kinase